MSEFDLGRTGRLFRAAADEGRRALVGFLPVGYPDVPVSLAALGELARACDLVEIGMPYSDPVMDGPVNQRAGTSALARGVRTRDSFAAAEAVAAAGGNSVVMTYWNLIENYGVDAYARDLANAGGSGLVTPDLTPDEAQEWFAASEAHGLDRIFLVAPSSSDERIASTVDACRGWLYATSVMGVTGVRAQSSAAAPELVRRVRELRPEVPVGIGLGVSNGAQAREIAEYADAVIVGSALVRTLIAAEDAGTPDDLSALRELLADLAAGVRG
ncbi:tryptophan synthase subunit alpha [Naumannella sp. ID2617S]|uniref:Tryptophan synthase alpha chain n=1 Tax=Enemella dayhoffiae TaxID=2016507 RepID=A0A255GU40_9ACTN|nr:tryptophan synthase subunit alpha [Enemella dayhoffiae]NNG19020.1 tryptophan synthase subunit alpha [Naumannella sp. ID2617S]OYO19249.1 tryptophan synthase subunit alpha [Enemella dayhoffiae]